MITLHSAFILLTWRWFIILTMASLFDGIGGFPLAAERYGITPIWASEIEMFPMEVTKIHFPGMIHKGDICKIHGAELPPVDIIAGGSPCQDLSVAGRRSGIEGERSGLFFEQIRIIKEMRYADRKRGRTAQSIRPRWGIWENVPGAYSSGIPPGEDFRVVLEEFVRIVDGSLAIPRPPTGRWEPAGAILGAGFSLAFRAIDSRWWGLAQRRKRIFLVADFGGFTAPQILFDPDRVPWDSAPGGEAGEAVAACAGTGSADTGGDPHGGDDDVEERGKTGADQ